MDALHKLVARLDLSRQEARDLADSIMDGAASQAQVGALLIALRMKGETAQEVAAFAEAMRRRVVRIAPSVGPLLDTCGTGGSSFRVFNVSTAAAFVAAAAGIPVAKHGNRAMSGVCGSADVLEALGVRLDRPPETIAACIETIGIGFLFAQAHHPAMKQVAVPRREIGVRTIFNLLGPLSNPAGATRQVVGVYDLSMCGIVAAALDELGSERAIVAHGEIGLDEVSTLGRTRIAELRDGRIDEYWITQQDLGLGDRTPDHQDLQPAATAAENAQFIRDVLGGKRSTRAAAARSDLVAANAAAALRVCDKATDWRAAVEQASTILASGAALDVLGRLIAFTQAA